MQRRSTNIKSEGGCGEIDLKTFYLPVRDTEIALERCRASASSIAATRDFPVKIKRSCRRLSHHWYLPLQDLGHHPQLFRIPPGTRLPRAGHDLCTFQMQTPTRSNHGSKLPMPTVKIRASTILGEFEQAQSELVGKAVILTDGKAGTVENVWLDEMHGLRISIRGHDGKWPISTVKFAQTG
jgi:hypothetical protein